MNFASRTTGRELSEFCGTVNSTICHSDFATIDSLHPISTCLEVVELGQVNVFRYDGQGVRAASRSIRHVRANPVDEFLVFVPLSRSIALNQGRHQGVINPGSFGILSSLKPYEIYCGEPPNHKYSELFVKVPGPLLRSRLPLIDEYCARPITAGQETGKTLNVVIETILDDGPRFNDTQASMFRSMVLDAIGVAALDAPEVTALHESISVTGHARVRQQATAFIEANLSNPAIDAAMVANGCHVSLRRLHEAFASCSTTVCVLIREMRIQRCRNDLRNPALAGQSAIKIAMRWGFSSSASFTRSYRAHFGTTPSEERRIGAAA